MGSDPVTQDEFGRFVGELGKRFDRLEGLVSDGFRAVNGRIATLEASHAVLDERVDTIQQRGCAVGAQVHSEPLTAEIGETGSWWRPSKSLTQGGVGAGILVGLVELAKAIVGALK